MTTDATARDKFQAALEFYREAPKVIDEACAEIDRLRDRVQALEAAIRERHDACQACGSYQRHGGGTCGACKRMMAAITPTTGAHAMRDPLRTDAARLAFLDWLTTRTEIQHAKVPLRPIGTDMHFDSTGCRIYVRNLTGQVVASGQGTTTRSAIDDCIASLHWQEPTS